MKSTDWLAVEAVQREPGSAPKSLFIREITGNFARLGYFLPKRSRITQEIQLVLGQFPAKFIRELFCSNREFVQESREASVSSARCVWWLLIIATIT